MEWLAGKDRIYPDLKIKYPESPNRLWAIPIFGGLVKLIILIPVMLYIYILALALVLMMLVNWAFVLFGGKFWMANYNLHKGVMTLGAKFAAYFFGMSERYPGFGFSGNEDVTLEVKYPENPSKLYAIPLLGILVRGILIIPFYLFYGIVNYASAIGVAFVASFAVLFTGKYPRGIYELNMDSLRMSMSYMMWFFGLEDRYPSFSIDLTNNRVMKLVLLLLGTLYLLSSFSNMNTSTKYNYGLPEQQTQQEYTLPEYE